VVVLAVEVRLMTEAVVVVLVDLGQVLHFL
jgi:hypothetical protein